MDACGEFIVSPPADGFFGSVGYAPWVSRFSVPLAPTCDAWDKRLEVLVRGLVLVPEVQPLLIFCQYQFIVVVVLLVDLT